MKKERKERKIGKVKFLHQKPVTAWQFHQLQKKVSDWHKFYYNKVYLPLTRNL